MDEQLMEKKIIKAKRKKKIWIYLICWPLIIFLLRIISSMIFWYINRFGWGGEQTISIRSKVNVLFGILMLFYIFILPTWIAVTVDAKNDLKKLNKDNTITNI